MSRFAHELYAIVLLLLALTGFVSFLAGGLGAFALGAIASAALLSFANHNTYRKEHQLLVWERAYAEWAALRREEPSSTVTTRDLLHDAHRIFHATPQQMKARWWENDISRYVRDARTWNEVLAWVEQSHSVRRA